MNRFLNCHSSLNFQLVQGFAAHRLIEDPYDVVEHRLYKNRLYFVLATEYCSGTRGIQYMDRPRLHEVRHLTCRVSQDG